MLKKVKVRDLRPNPFRDMKRYRILEEKIQALMVSMEETKVWKNLQGRQQNGYVELAAGHHRRVAIERKYGPDFEVEVDVNDYDDEAMLKIMAHENLANLHESAEVEQEMVRSVVNAYAKDIIKLEKLPAQTNEALIRYAPKFTAGKQKKKKGCGNDSFPHPPAPETHPYTADTVAAFLRWSNNDGKGGQKANRRVLNALSALEAIEKSVIGEDDVIGLTSDQSQELVKGALAIIDSYATAADGLPPRQQAALMRKGETLARSVASAVATKFRETNEKKKALVISNDRPKEKHYGVREGRLELEKAKYVTASVDPPPWVGDFALKLADEIRDILTPKDKRWEKLSAFVAARNDINEETKQLVVNALGRLSESCRAIAAILKGKKSEQVIAKLMHKESDNGE